MVADPVFQPEDAVSGDYFALFGLRRGFALDREELQKKFYALSRELHPDRFTTSSADAQKRSLEKMSQVNEAYRVLRDPELLRDYVLKLEGVALPAAKSTMPAELAESWFELQDELPGKLQEEKLSAFERDLERLRREHAEKTRELEKKIDAHYGHGHADRALLEQLAAHLHAGNYLQSIELDVKRIRTRLACQS